MKKFFTVTLLSAFASFSAMSQCAMVPQTLNEMVSSSEIIVEGTVSGKSCYWNISHTMIFTKTIISVSKIYKGNNLISANTVSITTEGGDVGYDRITAEPAFESENGEKGIFLITKGQENEWVSFGGPQGFIKFDMTSGVAANVFIKYKSIADAGLAIKTLTGVQPVVTGKLGVIGGSGKRAVISISSISPKTLSAGNNMSLTIKGTGFGATRDTSKVEFSNGDDGGATYVKALKRDYISWNDTQIVVIVRSKAGTGKPRVINAVNGTAISPDTLKVTYSHINIVISDSVAYESQEVGLNGQGITWTFNKKFNDSTEARNAFVRSIERWRCGTYINWDTAGRTSKNLVTQDGVNLVLWDSAGLMPNGVLAQCFTYWSGCFPGGVLKYYVSELDIRFRLKPTNTTTWHYKLSNAPGTKYDFETVATHEVGHGHQLGHVINFAEVMHYAVANGQTKRNLSAGDIAGGNYVIAKSTTPVCGKNGMVKLTNGNCALTPPSANFGIQNSKPCIGDQVTFTDSSKGPITAYSWNFGSGASPATASTVGPHKVTYSTGGSKTISLTITTPSGTKTKTIADSVVVINGSRVKASFTYNNMGNNIIGFKSNSTGSIDSTAWIFGDGDTLVSTNPIHNYISASGKTVRLIAYGICNTDDTVINLRSFTGIIKQDALQIFVIRPNPAKDNFQVLPYFSGNARLLIFDVLGQLVKEVAVSEGRTIEVSVMNMAKGIYTVTLLKENQVQDTQKLIIE
ncbi:MAG: T9SS type A sorting domain-containing protein [Bacteroidia bacterium]|nr:T9SS type A sorting domain-containing protein [Bacteroidia bacterium]